jgi:hypothetical protein
MSTSVSWCILATCHSMQCVVNIFYTMELDTRPTHHSMFEFVQFWPQHTHKPARTLSHQNILKSTNIDIDTAAVWAAYLIRSPQQLTA